MDIALHPQTLQRFAQHSDLLCCLDEAGFVRLARVGKLQHVPAGTIVLREGEPSYDLYLLAAGQMRVSMLEAAGREIAQLQQGAFFGEMALITRQPRSATVQATVNSQVVRFAYDAVVAILSDYPQVHELLGRVGLARTEANMQILSSSMDATDSVPGVKDYLAPQPLVQGEKADGSGDVFSQQDTPPIGILPPSRRGPQKL